MSHLSKLTIKSVLRQDTFDPSIARRNKLLAAIEEQLAVAASTIRGEEHVVTVSRWAKNEQGEKVRVQRQRITRPWFFAKDSGLYVQCRYGSKVLPLSKDGNAVFVKEIKQVETVLQAFYAAVSAGELDAALSSVVVGRGRSRSVTT
jgi:hypothetical protein